MLKRGRDLPLESDVKAFLGKGTTFKGILTFDGTVRIDGTLEGEIHTEDTLIVGEDAEITGEIRAGTVVSCGRITGNIFASQRATLSKPARVKGDIQAPLLTVEEGVVFDGGCRMSNVAAESGKVKPILREAGSEKERKEMAG